MIKTCYNCKNWRTDKCFFCRDTSEWQPVESEENKYIEGIKTGRHEETIRPSQLCAECEQNLAVNSSFDVTTKGKISKVCHNFKSLLHYKNTKYGDSALNPQKIFSKLSAEEAIKIRLDDKISRIINGQEIRKNDVVDVMGYLTLLCIANDWTDFEEFKD